MRKLTLWEALEPRLAEQRRHVVSDWRTFLLLRQVTDQIPPARRRWRAAPADLAEVRLLLERFSRQQLLRPLDGLPQIYQIATPYALLDPLQDIEVLFEAHPFCALAYASALAFHGLSEDFPRHLHVLIPERGDGGLAPLGMTHDDQLALDTIVTRRPKEILGREVLWHATQERRFFDLVELAPQGSLVRVTSRERTLLDGLRYPDRCGGFFRVLGAWRNARETLRVDRVLDLTERFEVAVLRQRVGFLLEELGVSSPRFDAWARAAKRGSSSVLAAGQPFASTFSERWQLSLNASLEALTGDPA